MEKKYVDGFARSVKLGLLFLLLLLLLLCISGCFSLFYIFFIVESDAGVMDGARSVSNSVTSSLSFGATSPYSSVVSHR